MAIKYTKNPSCTINPNLPIRGELAQPDLFEEGDTPPFVPLDELSEEQIKSLPFHAFTWDEWFELPEAWQVHIFLKDPDTKKIRRLDFEDTYSDDVSWGDMPEAIQYHIYEHDDHSKKRIEALAEALADHTPSDDADEIMQHNEDTIDSYMSDEERVWEWFGEVLMEHLEEAYPDVDWEDEGIQEGTEAAAKEYGFSQGNFEYSVVSGYNGYFPADAPGYYMEKHHLDSYFKDAPLDPDSMTEDEIEIALELASEKKDKFSDSGIDEDEIWKLIHEKWGTIERDYDHESWAIDVEPNWEEIVTDTVDHLPFDVDEEGAAPRVHYEEHPPEERILFRETIGSPDDLVHTVRVDFNLGETYYALDLIPSELKKETKRGKNCVGREENGYPEALRAGRIRLLSIRPESTENQWKRTYLLELVLDRDDTTSTLQEIVDRGGIHHVEQIKGYNNRVVGFDRGLYGKGTPEFTNRAEAIALLNLIDRDLKVMEPSRGHDTSRYVLPALEAPKKNPAGQACPIVTPRGERPYSFNVHTKN